MSGVRRHGTEELHSTFNRGLTAQPVVLAKTYEPGCRAPRNSDARACVLTVSRTRAANAPAARTPAQSTAIKETARITPCSRLCSEPACATNSPFRSGSALPPWRDTALCPPPGSPLPPSHSGCLRSPLPCWPSPKASSLLPSWKAAGFYRRSACAPARALCRSGPRASTRRSCPRKRKLAASIFARKSSR